VHRQGLDPGALGNLQDVQRVAVLAIPAGADLQRHRHFGHRVDHRIENACDQGLVLQQGGTCHDVADLLRRTAHVDVDDLRTAIDVVTRRLGHHHRIGAGDLHADRVDFAAVVGAPPGFRRAVQQRIRGHHLGHRHACAEPFA